MEWLTFIYLTTQRKYRLFSTEVDPFDFHLSSILIEVNIGHHKRIYSFDDFKMEKSCAIS